MMAAGAAPRRGRRAQVGAARSRRGKLPEAQGRRGHRDPEEHGQVARARRSRQGSPAAAGSGTARAAGGRRRPARACPGSPARSPAGGRRCRRPTGRAEPVEGGRRRERDRRRARRAAPPCSAPRKASAPGVEVARPRRRQPAPATVPASAASGGQDRDGGQRHQVGHPQRPPGDRPREQHLERAPLALAGDRRGAQARSGRSPAARWRSGGPSRARRRPSRLNGSAPIRRRNGLGMIPVSRSEASWRPNVAKMTGIRKDQTASARATRATPRRWARQVRRRSGRLTSAPRPRRPSRRRHRGRRGHRGRRTPSLARPRQAPRPPRPRRAPGTRPRAARARWRGP